MSVADCSETSVLRLCTLQPYVPLRRGPSESGSAIRHIGLRRRNIIMKREFIFGENMFPQVWHFFSGYLNRSDILS